MKYRYVASVMAPPEGHWKPCMDWCRDNIGYYTDRHSISGGPGWTYVGEGVFEFDRDHDHMLFLLKWS